MSNDTETATPEERLADVLAAVRSLAGGYEKLRTIPSGPEIASDIRVLLEVAEGPGAESNATVRARRRAQYVIEHVECPKCGRHIGEPCVSLNASLGDGPRRDRALPHRERDKADVERRRTIGKERP